MIHCNFILDKNPKYLIEKRIHEVDEQQQISKVQIFSFHFSLYAGKN